jgi:hypothetical protein
MSEKAFRAGPRHGVIALRKRALACFESSRSRTSFGDAPRHSLGLCAMPKANEAEALTIAVVDGPYDAAVLSGILGQAPVNLCDGSCSTNPSNARDHGTFIMGLLGAGRDAPIPGLCSGCRLLHIPLFVDAVAPAASVGELAHAIGIAVAAGAKLINLSLAILGDDSQYDRELDVALDQAEASGAVVVVAAGNQGRLAMGQLLSHPVTIPVVATDAAGRLLPESNFGPAISHRGIAALGHHVLGYAPGAGTTVMSGTSVATAVATGTLAELWSAHPNAEGETLRAAVARLAPRNGSIPPMIDRNVLSTMLNQASGTTIMASAAMQRSGTNYTSLQGGSVVKDDIGMTRPFNRGAEAAASPTNIVTPSNGSGGCSCGAPGGACTCAGSQGASGFVYAIGTVEAEYPNVGIEREMQMMGMGIEAEPEVPMKSTEDRHWQHAVLTKDRKKTRYLARQLSWRLTIEDLPAFVLKPRDCCDFDDLIDCLNRPKYPKPDGGKRKKGKTAASDPNVALLPDDLDVIVGVKGANTPDGIEVYVDQIFQRDILFPHKHVYFSQIVDNYGLKDEDRAYNFLTARYDIAPKILEVQKEFVQVELEGVPTIYSRLSGDANRIVRVIFTFKGHLKGHSGLVERKYFVRVDVTNEFPVIITPWHPYLDRGDAS